MRIKDEAERKKKNVTAAFLGLKLIKRWARSERSKIDQKDRTNGC